jgi:hypothetical protein
MLNLFEGHLNDDGSHKSADATDGGGLIDSGSNDDFDDDDIMITDFESDIIDEILNENVDYRQSIANNLKQLEMEKTNLTRQYLAAQDNATKVRIMKELEEIKNKIKSANSEHRSATIDTMRHSSAKIHMYESIEDIVSESDLIEEGLSMLFGEDKQKIAQDIGSIVDADVKDLFLADSSEFDEYESDDRIEQLVLKIPEFDEEDEEMIIKKADAITIRDIMNESIEDIVAESDEAPHYTRDQIERGRIHVAKILHGNRNPQDLDHPRVRAAAKKAIMDHEGMSHDEAEDHIRRYQHDPAGYLKDYGMNRGRLKQQVRDTNKEFDKEHEKEAKYHSAAHESIEDIVNENADIADSAQSESAAKIRHERFMSEKTKSTAKDLASRGDREGASHFENKSKEHSANAEKYHDAHVKKYGEKVQGSEMNKNFIH